jgi:hypothetical protein
MFAFHFPTGLLNIYTPIIVLFYCSPLPVFFRRRDKSFRPIHINGRPLLLTWAICGVQMFQHLKNKSRHLHQPSVQHLHNQFNLSLDFVLLVSSRVWTSPYLTDFSIRTLYVRTFLSYSISSVLLWVWNLVSDNKEHSMRLSKNRVLRRIFGPSKRFFLTSFLILKYESMLMRSPCSLCVCASPLINSEWLNNLYETWYAFHGTWVNLNGVLHKSLPSVCLSVLTYPLSLLGNGSVKRFRVTKYTHNKGELLEVSFSKRSLSYRSKRGDQFFPELFFCSESQWLH